MRPASANLISFLQSKQPYWSADLFTIQLANGDIFYLTSADQPITANGNLYSAVGPAITRSSWQVKNTTDVPALNIQIYSDGADWPNGLNFKQIVHQGYLDGAYIELDRAFMPVFGDVALGTVLLFGGRTSTVIIDGLGIKLSVKGDNVLMQQFFPKNQYQTGCIHTLYDSGCTLLRSNFTFNGNVGSSGVNQIFVPWAAAPGVPADLVLGGFTLTSGLGIGQIRTVQAVQTSPGGFVLAYPLDELPAPGDSFTVTFGCDKQLSTCTNRFNNQTNYRGFPFIPQAETAY
jgi:uncharacterized phage protein (TIGR02218 family)